MPSEKGLGLVPRTGLYLLTVSQFALHGTAARWSEGPGMRLDGNRYSNYKQPHPPRLSP